VIVVAQTIQHGTHGEVLSLNLSEPGPHPESPPAPNLYGKRLSAEDLEGCIRAWQLIRAQFQCDPKTAILYADLLMSDLVGVGMSAGQSTAALRYRTAHAIARSGNARIARRAELDRAMQIYASLFDDLVLRTARACHGLNAPHCTLPEHRS
jgi:hypothetical protein